MPAHTQTVLKEAISSSPMQTTEIQVITPQETNMSSSPLNSCTADGNGIMTQRAEGIWQCTETHTCLEQKFMHDDVLYIAISINAMLLLIKNIDA